jgi:predicted TIM-barrel fold metal-dependent hydrolase
MPDIRITNCHIHLFTDRHTPLLYPHWLLRPFRSLPAELILGMIAWVVGLFSERQGANLQRLLSFITESGRWTQEKVLKRVDQHYPSGTRYVVLPMDMEHSGYGRVRTPLSAQLDELLSLSRSAPWQGRLLPFATLDPRGPDRADEIAMRIGTGDFRGLKVYPRLGYPPDHPELMDKIYPLLVSRGLPVMTHCSRGGMTGKGVVPAHGDRLSAPEAWDPVLQRFPTLRVCLAHFGGQADWAAFARPDLFPSDPRYRDSNWVRVIKDRVGSGHWPGLWTDISYTMFQFDEFIPFLRVFLTGDDDASERLRRRVLFGSDYYMTRQEHLSEREVCFRLRNALGEDVFRRIAEENPAVWLGEQAERPWTVVTAA